MSRPILHGTALCPLLRFPRGAKLRLKVVMDSDLPLAGKDLLFAARPRSPIDGVRPLYRITNGGTEAAWSITSPNTVELTLAPDAADETEESELTLADLQARGEMLWRLDVLDAEGWPTLRLQGDLQWLPEEGTWPDEPASQAALPTLSVSIVEGVATVTVALLSESPGATVDNAAVVAAIEEDAAAVRTALELGTAATTDASAYAAASHTQAISTITGLQDALDAKAATASLGNAATKNSGEANGVASLGSDGKIPSAQLPAIAIVDYLGTAANEAAMLALTGQKGDWAQRTDLGTMWFITGDDPTQLASWREMTYPTAPVSSVAGLTGSIASGDLRTALGLATTSDVTFETLYASEYGDYATPSLAFAGTCGFLRNDNDVLYKNSNIAFLVFQHPGGFTMTDYYGPAPIRWGGLGNNGVVASYSLGIEKEAVGLLAVTSGTSGQYRDAKMRDLILLPSASKTPANNGELVVEATSNTSVTIKLKGSDGTVRSVALTLS